MPKTPEEKREDANRRRRESYARNKQQGGGALRNKLRWDVIPDNLERFDVIVNGVNKRFKDEVIGLKWTALEEKLPSLGIPPGKYNYSIKFVDSPMVDTGVIKSVGNRIMEENKDLTKIEKNIDELKKAIMSKTSGSVDSLPMEFMLSTVKQTHEAEIQLYKLQLQFKDDRIIELQGTIDYLNLELDKAERIVEQLQNEGGAGKTADAITSLVNNLFKQKSEQPRAKLSERFNGSDIPEDIIQILTTVEYKQIPQNQMDGLKKGLQMIVDQLPQKAA